MQLTYCWVTCECSVKSYRDLKYCSMIYLFILYSKTFGHRTIPYLIFNEVQTNYLYKLYREDKLYSCRSGDKCKFSKIINSLYYLNTFHSKPSFISTLTLLKCRRKTLFYDLLHYNYSITLQFYSGYFANYFCILNIQRAYE